MTRYVNILLCAAGALCLCGCELPIDATIDSMDEVRMDELRANWFASTAGIPSPDQPGMENERLEAEIGENFGMRKHPDMPFYDAPPDQSGRFSGRAAPLGGGTPPVELSDEPVDCDFNFSQASLVDVLPVFRNALNFNYVIEGDVTGTVTMSLRTKLSRRALWDTFLELMNISGARVSCESGVVHIYPVGYAGSSLSLNSDEPGLEVAAFHLSNQPVNEMIPRLNTFIGRTLRAVELPSANMLLVLDRPEELAKVEMLLRELDVPNRRNWHRLVLPCRNVDAERIADELGQIMPVLGFQISTTRDKAPEGMIHLQALPRVQVIVASAANPDALEELARWHGLLDENNIGDQEQLFMYNVINSKAEELSAAVSSMFNVSGIQISSTGDGEATQNTDIGTPGTLPSNDATAPGTVFENPVRIFCDAVHNRLAIRTRPRTYAMIKAMLERLDTPPAQVLLQVMVVEVSLTDSIEFGVEFMLQDTVSTNWNAAGGTDYKTLVPSAQQNKQYGGKFYIYNPDNPEEKFGYITALASQSNIRVISSPQIACLNNHKAKITVGDKVPLITSETGNTASGDTILRKVEYRDTGIQLDVKPRATRGGRIIIDLNQEISQAQVNTTSTIDSPVIQNREVSTSMSLRDGQTIICGGIIRDKTVDDLDTLPIINSIPFLRRFLGDTNVQSDRTELLILITGTIIKEPTRLEALTGGFEQSIDSLIEYNNMPKKKITRQFKHSGSLDTWFFE